MVTTSETCSFVANFASPRHPAPLTSSKTYLPGCAGSARQSCNAKYAMYYLQILFSSSVLCISKQSSACTHTYTHANTLRMCERERSWRMQTATNALTHMHSSGPNAVAVAFNAFVVFCNFYLYYIFFDFFFRYFGICLALNTNLPLSIYLSIFNFLFYFYFFPIFFLPFPLFSVVCLPMC